MLPTVPPQAPPEPPSPPSPKPPPAPLTAAERMLAQVRAMAQASGGPEGGDSEGDDPLAAMFGPQPTAAGRHRHPGGRHKQGLRQQQRGYVPVDPAAIPYIEYSPLPAWLVAPVPWYEEVSCRPLGQGGWRWALGVGGGLLLQWLP